MTKTFTVQSMMAVDGPKITAILIGDGRVIHVAFTPEKGCIATQDAGAERVALDYLPRVLLAFSLAFSAAHYEQRCRAENVRLYRFDVEGI